MNTHGVMAKADGVVKFEGNTQKSQQLECG